jgi:hypothetical protein
MSKKTTKKTVLTFGDMEDAHEQGNLIIFKLGTEIMPASAEEMSAFRDVVLDAKRNKCDIVWNHAVEVLFVSTIAKVILVGE